jgi:tetratricopeptide (TPR) repeat protein
MNPVVDLVRQALAARKAGDTKAAEAAAREALSLARARADEGGRDALIVALSVMAQVDQDAGRLDVATQRYAQAAEFCRRPPPSPRLAHVLRHLGMLQFRARNLLAAISCCEEAVELRRGEEGCPPLELANTLRPLALIREAEGRDSEAAALWEEASSLYAAAGVESGVRESQARLAALASAGA